jgi:hypothetical protein
MPARPRQLGRGEQTSRLHRRDAVARRPGRSGTTDDSRPEHRRPEGGGRRDSCRLRAGSARAAENRTGRRYARCRIVVDGAATGARDSAGRQSAAEGVGEAASRDPPRGPRRPPSACEPSAPPRLTRRPDASRRGRGRPHTRLDRPARRTSARSGSAGGQDQDPGVPRRQSRQRDRNTCPRLCQRGVATARSRSCAPRSHTAPVPASDERDCRGPLRRPRSRPDAGSASGAGKPAVRTAAEPHLPSPTLVARGVLGLLLAARQQVLGQVAMLLSTAKPCARVELEGVLRTPNRFEDVLDDPVQVL